nr:uracil-DNA glycosylase [uncultured Rhodoferax sp.]
MALTLDERQRAMLLEMGVRVWLPGTVFDTEPPSLAVSTAQPAVAPQPAAPAPAVPAPPPVRAVPVVRPPVVVARAAGTPLDLGALDWEALADTAASCQACGLCAGRKSATLQPAPGQRDWMVVGDPPEEDEDRAAQAFVESPGLLLDNMLKAVGASRSADAQGATAAYATNVVKCRPPHGQIPQAADLAQCAQYLQREITLVQPKVILAMGRFAIQTLLAEHGALATQPLGKLRGTVYQYQGIPVIVTYHPKMLLRNSADKAKAWADLCLAMDVRDASVK